MRKPAVLFLLAVAFTVAVRAEVWTTTDPAYAVKTTIPNLTAAPIAFSKTGDLYLLDARRFGPPCLYSFPAASTLPFGATIPYSYSPGKTCAQTGGVSVTGATNTAIIVTNAGRMYQTGGQEINLSTKTVVRTAFDNCGAGHGIALDPTDGSLFISDYPNKLVYKVPNPDTRPGKQTAHCAVPFFNASRHVDSGIDGLTVGPDGTVYMAAYNSATFVIVSKTGQLIANKETGVARDSTKGPDGISICIGDGNSFAMTTTARRGEILKFNLTGPGGAPTYAYTSIASNGATAHSGYVDWTAVDNLGCIWGTTMDGPSTYGVFRISNADGTCLSCSAPQVPVPPDDGPCGSCSKVVHVAAGSDTATASSDGDCVALVFDN